MYVANRRAKPIVSTPESSSRIPRVPTRNSSSRFFELRCAAHSSSAGSSRVRSNCGSVSPSSPSSSPEIHVRCVDAVRDRRDRHLVDAPVGPQAVPHLPRHRAVQLRDPVRVLRRAERERRQPEARVPGRRPSRAPRSRPTSGRSAPRAPSRLCRTSSGLEDLVARRHRRVRREDGRGAEPFERLVGARASAPRRARASARAGGTRSGPRSGGRPSARARAGAARGRRRCRARAPAAAGSRGRRRRATSVTSRAHCGFPSIFVSTR